MCVYLDIYFEIHNVAMVCIQMLCTEDKTYTRWSIDQRYDPPDYIV